MSDEFDQNEIKLTIIRSILNPNLEIIELSRDDELTDVPFDDYWGRVPTGFFTLTIRAFVKKESTK